MQISRIFAVAVVAMMACAIIPIAAIDGADSDASGSVGEYNFYLYSSASQYTLYTSTGFNASDALTSQSTLLTAMDSTVDNNYSKQYTNQYGTYTSINDEWGKITRNSSSAVDGSAWIVYVYTYDGQDGAGQWKIADKTLGFYKPFDDYNGSYATANVALYYGETGTTMGLPTSGYQSLTAVTETDTFAVNFEIMYDDGDEYYYLTGYGSDAGLALIDAVGDDVSLKTTPGLDYGYLYSMYDLATSDSSGTWMWWHMMNDTKDDPAYTDSAFYIGFYTPLEGFALSCNTISLTYY